MAGNESSKVPILAIVGVLVLGGIVFALSRPATPTVPSYTSKAESEKSAEKVAAKETTAKTDTTEPKKDDATSTPAPKPGEKPVAGGETKKPEDPKNPNERHVLFTYLTRQGATYYQSSKRFEDLPVTFDSMPGSKEVAEMLAKQGRQIPQYVYFSQQDTDTRVECLGQQTYTISSYCGYRHPTEGVTLAYDVALSSGGVPQRMVGHLKPSGVQVDVYQGELKVDEQEVKFPRSANIMPLDLNFIYQWYLTDQAAMKEKGQESKPMRWLFFVPEVSGFVALTARPIGAETIPHRGQNRDCVKFEILTASTQALAGLVSRQEMWFDKSDGTLLRRQEVDEANANSTNFTERAGVDDLKTLQPLIQRPPVLPDAPFPYPFEKDLTYRIRSGEKQIGRVLVRFSKRQDEKGNFIGYRSNSSLDISTDSTTRKESTETTFDTQFLPLQYAAQGQETAEVEANYRVTATFAGNRVLLNLLRDVVTPVPTAVPLEHIKVKENWDEPGVEHPGKALDGEWTPPLRLVKFVGDEIRDELPPPPKPRHQDEKLERPLSQGALIMDYHRVEHFALAAFRFPRPAWPKPAADGSIAAFGSNFERRYQNTAFFSVRQNLTGIPQFAIVPEHRAAKSLNAELDPDLKDLETFPDDPPLFVAGTSHSMMPCTMLLDETGRLLQLNMKYGAHEIVFSLDDPIMQRREEKMRVLKGQEGPTLLRPPWY